MSNWLPSGHLPSWLILFFVQNSSLHNNTIYTIYLLKLELQLPLIPSLSSHSEQPTVHVQVLSGDLLNGNGEDLTTNQFWIGFQPYIINLTYLTPVVSSSCVITMWSCVGARCGRATDPPGYYGEWVRRGRGDFLGWRQTEADTLTLTPPEPELRWCWAGDWLAGRGKRMRVATLNCVHSGITGIYEVARH